MDALDRIRALQDLDSALGALPENVVVGRVGGLWTVRVGPETAPRTLAVVAGLHAAELLGVVSALAVARSFAEAPVDGWSVRIAPAVDRAAVEANARRVARAGTWERLLELESPRDLEHDFGGGHPETAAVADWLDGLPGVDGFLDLHAACCLSGGVFAYAEGVAAVGLAGALGEEARKRELALVDRDPTGLGTTRLGPGTFVLPEAPGSCLAHVRARHRPRAMWVPEIPVGVVDGAGDAEDCARLTAAATRGEAVGVRWVDPADHAAVVVAVARRMVALLEPR